MYNERGDVAPVLATDTWIYDLFTCDTRSPCQDIQHCAHRPRWYGQYLSSGPLWEDVDWKVKAGITQAQKRCSGPNGWFHGFPWPSQLAPWSQDFGFSSENRFDMEISTIHRDDFIRQITGYHVLMSWGHFESFVMPLQLGGSHLDWCIYIYHIFQWVGHNHPDCHQDGGFV